MEAEQKIDQARELLVKYISQEETEDSIEDIREAIYEENPEFQEPWVNVALKAINEALSLS